MVASVKPTIELCGKLFVINESAFLLLLSHYLRCILTYVGTKIYNGVYKKGVSEMVFEFINVIRNDKIN